MVAATELVKADGVNQVFPDDVGVRALFLVYLSPGLGGRQQVAHGVRVEPPCTNNTATS